MVVAGGMQTSSFAWHSFGQASLFCGASSCPLATMCNNQFAVCPDTKSGKPLQSSQVVCMMVLFAWRLQSSVARLSHDLALALVSFTVAHPRGARRFLSEDQATTPTAYTSAIRLETLTIIKAVFGVSARIKRFASLARAPGVIWWICGLGDVKKTREKNWRISTRMRLCNV